jgi:outer membrane protein TolC
MRFGMVVLALIPAVAPAMSQETPTPPRRQREIKLSLRECIHLALERNRDIEIARYQPRIEDGNVLAALGPFDRVSYVSASGGKSVTKPTNPFDIANIETDTFTSSAGLKEMLPVGVSWDLSFQASRTETNSFLFSAINPFWQESLRLSLTVPVLKGRGEDARYAGVLVAMSIRRAALDRFEKTLSDEVAAVQWAYWDLVFARELLEVRRQSEKVAQLLLEENRGKFEKGVLMRVDVTEAEAALAAQREGILTAENGVLAAADRLKRLIDPALLREEVVLVPTDEPPPFERSIDENAALAQAVAQGIEKRAEFRELAGQIAAQEQTLRKARNDLLPKLDLIASGALTGLEDSFGRASHDLWSREFHEWTVGVSFELPFEGRAARGALDRAELERRRLDLQRTSLEDQLLMEARAAVRDIKTAEKRIEATRRARELAQERFDGESSRRDAGLRTTFHVLDAEERLTEAKSNEVRARIDYALAEMSLRQASGTLLEHWGVTAAESLAPRRR